MGNFAKLFLDRCIDLWMIVAMNVAPQAAYAIQVTSATIIDQPISFATFDEPRFIFGHLRERMPNLGSVPIAGVRRTVFWGHEIAASRG